MLKRCHQIVLSLLCGCLLCLVLASVTNADGRVFVSDLKNSSGLLSFRDAERACASRHARLASPAELRHAVVECFFSTCTRGWLYGGTVGTTVCNDVRGTLKAVDVKTENATDDAARLDAFCIKDKGTPCGDPPSFPNARLQGHSGYEMGDELLYTCVPGYVMPSGHSAFSLLCDSCGEWYGLVEICVKDETESHIDYEDKFTDSYGETEHHHERLEEAQGEVHEEVHGAAYLEGTTSQEQQETSFSVEDEAEHQDQRAVHERDEVAVEAGPEEERAVEDSAGHPSWEQERRDGDTVDLPAATEEPVSLLSQKHLFWFPSEAFQDEGHPISSNPVTSQRASGAQSEESQENESQERQHHQRPVDVHDHETDSHDDDDAGDDDDHDDGRHHEQEDHDSHQEEEDHDEWTKHYTPAQRDDLDRRDHHESRDDHDEHYDMGEHENDQNHVTRYGSQDYDDQDDAYDEHESYEDLEDVTEDPGADDEERSESSKEHIENDDQEEHYDEEEEDDHDHFSDHDDHEHDVHDDHDSHEDVHGGHQHVIFSVATDDHQNITQDGEGGEATTDETWLDGYPVNAEETETGDSTTDGVRPEEAESTIVVRITDRPNEVEISRPGDYTSSVEASDFPTADPALEQEGEDEMWPEPTAGPSSDHPQSSDHDTQQVAPTRSWLGDFTDRPFLDHEPSPPAHDGDILTGENTVHDLPGEIGERGEIEGEMGETVCTGENCPPPSSSNRGPTLAAIIVALCVVAAAVVIGVWCYRRQQQKSSMYELNGKGQSQTRQGQQIEMQQKV